MTDRKELEQLQSKARKAGRVCNFYIKDGWIDGVFYEGRITTPLAFAERERTKPHYRVTLSKPRLRPHGEKCKCVGENRITFDFFGSIADCKAGIETVTPYDVLACISGDVHCADTFEDFCGEFGESEDSIKALQMWRRCSAFSKRLKAFFTSEEIEALGEIS